MIRLPQHVFIKIKSGQLNVWVIVIVLLRIIWWRLVTFKRHTTLPLATEYGAVRACSRQVQPDWLAIACILVKEEVSSTIWPIWLNLQDGDTFARFGFGETGGAVFLDAWRWLTTLGPLVILQALFAVDRRRWNSVTVAGLLVALGTLRASRLIAAGYVFTLGGFTQVMLIALGAWGITLSADIVIALRAFLFVAIATEIRIAAVFAAWRHAIAIGVACRALIADGNTLPVEILKPLRAVLGWWWQAARGVVDVTGKALRANRHANPAVIIRPIAARRTGTSAWIAVISCRAVLLIIAVAQAVLGKVGAIGTIRRALAGFL